MSGHLSLEELRALMQGSLAPMDVKRAKEHLKACDACANQWRQLRRQRIEEVDATPTLESSDAQTSNSTAVEPKSVNAEDLPTIAYSNSDSSAVSDIPRLAPGKQFGPYRIEAKLGQGGMGSVYRARHIKLDKLVALKVVHEQNKADKKFIARFEREMKAVGKVEHPHIVRALNAGEIEGVPYLAMEFLEGTDLLSYVRQRGCLTPINACKIIRQAAEALRVAHDAGLVHRDIKPSNLFLTKSGQVKVLDLGLALVSDDNSQATALTQAGQAFGTPDYMAPEQWDNAHTTDGRVDLYALGCTLHFLLVGRPPFASDEKRTPYAKMKAHLDADIPSLKQLRPDTPDGVDEIFNDLLAKQPVDRIANAGDLVERLTPFCKPQPAAQTQKTLANDQGAATSAWDDLSASLPPQTYAGAAVSSANAMQSPWVANAPKKSSNNRRSISGKKWIWSSAAAATVFLIIAVSKFALMNRVASDVPAQPLAARVATETVTSTDSGESAAKVNEQPTKVEAAPIVKKNEVEPFSNAEDDLKFGTIDFAEERKAAERFLALGANLRLRLANGTHADFDSSKTLPNSDFYIASVTVREKPLIDDDLSGLTKCRRIKSLVLDGTRVTGIGLRHLLQVQSIEHIGLPWQLDSQGKNELLHDAGLVLLPEFKQLGTLNLDGNSALTDNCLDYVSQCPFLTEFAISRSARISDDGLLKLSKLSKLSSLSLADSNVTDSGMKRFLESVPGLTFLSIENELPSARVTTLGVERSMVTNLVSHFRQLRNSTVESPGALSNLDRLSLTEPEGRTIAQVLRLSQLKSLTFNVWHADHDGLKEEHYALLARHPSVENLVLNGASGSPTDSSLLELAKLPKLKELFVTYGTATNPRRYTSEGIARFRAARPDVRLHVDGQTFEANAGAKPTIELNPVESREELVNSVPLQPDGHEPINIVGKPQPPGPSIRSWFQTTARKLQSSPGRPISPRAYVSRPPELKGLASWTIEPVCHVGSAISSATSPDGATVATSGIDGTIRIWQRDNADATSIRLAKVFLGDGKNIVKLRWSRSGEYIAASYAGDLLTIFDANTGAKVWSSPVNIEGSILVWSKDDRYLVCGGYGVEVIDLKGRKRQQLDQKYNLSGLTVDSTHNTVYTIKDGNTLEVFDLSSLKKTTEFKLPANLAVSCELAISHNDELLTIGTADGRILLWDTTNQRIEKDIKVTNAGVSGLHWEQIQSGGSWFTNQGERLLVHADKLYQMDRGANVQVIESNIPTGLINWSPNAQEILYVSQTGYQAFDTVSKRTSGKSVHVAGAKPIVHLSVDGKLVRSVDGSNINIFDAESGELQKRVPAVLCTEMLGSSKDDWLVCLDANRPSNPPMLIDARTYERRIALSGHQGTVFSAAWSPTSAILATTSADKTVRLWEADSGKELKSLTHARPVLNVAWSRDGKYLATCSDDVIHIWDSASGSKLKDYPKLSNRVSPSSHALDWSADGSSLAIASYTGRTEALDFRSGNVVEAIKGRGSGILSVEWSPDGKILSHSDGGDWIALLPIKQKSPIYRNGSGRPFWFPDSQRVLTGTESGNSAQVLDVKRGLAIVGTLITSFPDNKWITICGNGHYRSSEGIESEIVYVALELDGSQKTYSPKEFAARFGWKNDPTQATLSKVSGR